MDEIREQMDIANEISDAISQPLGGELFDEDDLLSELEDLEQESLDEQLLGLEQPAKLPTAPTKAPVGKQPAKASTIDEDEELRALELSMA